MLDASQEAWGRLRQGLGRLCIVIQSGLCLKSVLSLRREDLASANVSNIRLHRNMVSYQTVQMQNMKAYKTHFISVSFLAWTTVAPLENSSSFCLRSSSILTTACLNIQPTTLTLFRSAPCLHLWKTTLNGKVCRMHFKQRQIIQLVHYADRRCITNQIAQKSHCYHFGGKSKILWKWH